MTETNKMTTTINENSRIETSMRLNESALLSVSDFHPPIDHKSFKPIDDTHRLQSRSASPFTSTISRQDSGQWKYRHLPNDDLDFSSALATRVTTPIQPSSPIMKKEKRPVTKKKSRPSKSSSEQSSSTRLWYRDRLLAWMRATPRIPPSLIMAVGFVVALSLAVLISYSMIPLVLPKCRGAPYLYVSHSGAKNILKFSLDGCLLTTKVLWGNFEHSDLRGLIVDKNSKQDVLYVADSSESSQILKFGPCSRLSGMRELIGKVSSYASNEGIQHPYSLSVDDDHNIYATFQNTDVLLRFHKDTYKPMDFPPLLLETQRRVMQLTSARKNAKKGKDNNDDTSTSSLSDPVITLDEFYPGTFLQFGDVGYHKHKDQGIRAVQFVRGKGGSMLALVDDPSYLRKNDSRPQPTFAPTIANAALATYRPARVWVTNKNLASILVVDALSGNLSKILYLSDPIGLHVDYDHNVMFVGSKASKAAQVIAYDLDTYEIKKTYTLLSMKHPTGISTLGEELIVADQSAKAIWAFNITSSRFLRLIAGPDVLDQARVGDLELLALSSC